MSKNNKIVIIVFILILVIISIYSGSSIGESSFGIITTTTKEEKSNSSYSNKSVKKNNISDIEFIESPLTQKGANNNIREDSFELIESYNLPYESEIITNSYEEDNSIELIGV
jgi:hypothetical protein